MHHRKPDLNIVGPKDGRCGRGIRRLHFVSDVLCAKRGINCLSTLL